MAKPVRPLTKEEKLAAKLRENLKRRKAQTKQRANSSDGARAEK